MLFFIFFIEDICKEHCIEIIEREIMPDHVHLLIEVDPQYGLHKANKKKEVPLVFCVKNLTGCLRGYPLYG